MLTVRYGRTVWAMHWAEENSVTQGTEEKRKMGNEKDYGGEHLKQNIFGATKAQID